MKHWQKKPQAPLRFKKQLSGYPEIILDLLFQRGLRNAQAVNAFLNPCYEKDIHEPLLLKGMKKARDRVIKAIKNKEEVAIFGDYDADGVCGAAVLNSFFDLFDLKPKVYIPGRINEGYGLNQKAVQQLADQGVKLIITVDCGVSDFTEVKLANQLGIEVIILDHHYVEDNLPSALAIVDPWQKGCRYPFKGLSGVGVVFKLIQALLATSFVKKNPASIPAAFDKWLLDLVALGTVTDCMPLLDENRTIVKYGLLVLAQTQRPGLQVLMKIAGIQPMVDTKNLTTNLDSYCLGYILGPRLNAAGRMAHANTAYELLVCQSAEEAEFLAKRLQQKNQERQERTEEILKAVKQKIEQKGQLGKIIFEGDENWPIGVNGLVAGKIADQFFRPTFIFKIEGEKAFGSARSIPKFNIVKALGKTQKLLLEFGGHAGAAGFSLEKKNLELLSKKLESIAGQKLKKEDLIPQINIDLTLRPDQISWQTYAQIQKLAPFGQANPFPCFLLENLEVISIALVGRSAKHLRLDLKTQNQGQLYFFRAIGFNFSDWAQKLKLGDYLDLVFELLADDWRGPEQVQLKIVDLRLSKE